MYVLFLYSVIVTKILHLWIKCKYLCKKKRQPLRSSLLCFLYLQNYIHDFLALGIFLNHFSTLRIFGSSISLSSMERPSCLALRSSPHPISNSQLHALLHFHLCPIYLVVFKGSYFFRMGYLILRGASRLDAFSVYPCRTWLPCHGSGKPTGTPAVRPSRSSRTKDSSSQISYAHAG